MAIKPNNYNLLKEHNELFFELIKIPEQREISFKIDEVDGNKIGKPRFNNPEYSWPSDLLLRLKMHLETIFNFFETYSYWFDDTIKPLLVYDNNKITKKSIIYLLQSDIWETDEVYGNYLIEKSLSKYSISYFHIDRKIKTFVPNINSLTELEHWICIDAKKQIIDQFSFLWNYLQVEIEFCAKQDYFNIPGEFLTSDYIINQNRKIAQIINEYPEYALLNLGRIAELYLLQLLKLLIKPKDVNLAWKARNNGLLTNQQASIFESIRKEHNLLKHSLNYSINIAKLGHLWNNFTAITRNK
jgi:hypothetical protein